MHLIVIACVATATRHRRTVTIRCGLPAVAVHHKRVISRQMVLAGGHQQVRGRTARGRSPNGVDYFLAVRRTVLEHCNDKGGGYKSRIPLSSEHQRLFI